MPKEIKEKIEEFEEIDLGIIGDYLDDKFRGILARKKYNKQDIFDVLDYIRQLLAQEKQKWVKKLWGKTKKLTLPQRLKK